MFYHGRVTADLQPALFSAGTSADPEALAALDRIDLGRGAWVDHLESWLTDDVDVYEALCRQVPWQQERRVMFDNVVSVPRLTAWCTDPARLPHPSLVRAFDALNAHYGPEPFTTAGLCWYRDGRDSVAWHGDNVGRHRPTTLIAIVSLGEARPLSLRPRGGGPSRSFPLGHGDLLVMGGTCQSTFEHAVPKVAAAGPRISVQFRQAGVF